MTTDRRTFLRSLSTLLVAPAIVRASSLMAISVAPPTRSIIRPENWFELDSDKVYLVRYIPADGGWDSVVQAS